MASKLNIFLILFVSFFWHFFGLIFSCFFVDFSSLTSLIFVFPSRRNAYFRQFGVSVVQRWANMAQDGPKMAPRGPKKSQDLPKRAQDRPKIAPRGYTKGPILRNKWCSHRGETLMFAKKGAPVEATHLLSQSWLQDGPNIAQDGPNMAPRWRQVGPRWIQEGPRSFKISPRRPKIAPRRPKRDPK